MCTTRLLPRRADSRLSGLLVLLGLTLTHTSALAADPGPPDISIPEITPEPPPTPEPTPDTPTTTPAPAPTPTLTRTPTTPARSANDRLMRFEVTLSSELTFFTSTTPTATTDEDFVFNPSLRMGLGLTEHLVLSLGWRAFAEMSRGDLGYALTTSGDAAIVTARYEFPLTRAFAVAAELDLELSHLDYDLTVGSMSGHTSTWGFGAIPRAVFITRADLEDLSLDLRVFVGLALRLAYQPSDLRLDSDAAEVAPLDLGSLDLSGLTLGATFALSF